jgi:thiamine-monophosphate kinase
MRSIGDVGEQGLIERIARPERGQHRGAVVLGIGDDAAVLRPRKGEDVVVSSDAAVEGVHFRFETATPRNIGRRALVANLSDLAAMGARPFGFTLALAAPPSLPLAAFDGLFAGMRHEAGLHACPLVGGNLTRARETSLVITVIGGVARGRALRRDGLRAGDRLFVTGDLGKSALAVARAERGDAPHRYVATPRLAAGRALARMNGVGGCIDLSDGFASDLGHCLRASGCGADITTSAVPLPRGYRSACRRLGVDPLRLALTGGEDYELLFSLRASVHRRTTAGALSSRLATPVTEVGSVSATRGLRGLPFSARSPAQAGWRHF